MLRNKELRTKNLKLRTGSKHLDPLSIVEPALAGYDDVVAFVEPGEHLDQVAFLDAKLDGLLDGGVVLGDEDMGAPQLADHRFPGQ